MYCGGTDRCYLLPSELDRRAHGDLASQSCPPVNGQRACINLASRITSFAGAVAQLEERRGWQPRRSGVRAPSAPLPHRALRTGCHEFRNHFGLLPRAGRRRPRDRDQPPRPALRPAGPGTAAPDGRLRPSCQAKVELPDRVGYIPSAPPCAGRTSAAARRPSARFVPARRPAAAIRSLTPSTRTFGWRRRRPTAPSGSCSGPRPDGRAPRRLAAADRSERAGRPRCGPTGPPVPEPVHTRDGELTVTVAAAGVPEPRTCSPLRWMNGRIHTGSPRPVHLRRLAMRDGTAAQPRRRVAPPADFARIRWDWEAFFGDTWCTAA